MERVINIIGMGMSSKNCPDTGENWGVNLSYKYCHNLDKLFFMDDLQEVLKGDSFLIDPEYTFDKFLKDNPTVELISRHEDNVKNIQDDTLTPIKQYPLNEALSLIPGGYFTSTIAYMICYAILQKVDRIRLYGFEIWSGSDANEYNYQRPCLDFWLAFAMGRGIKIEVPYYLMLTAISNQNFYGYFKGELSKNLL